MSDKVYKYQFSIPAIIKGDGVVTINVPSGSRFLSVINQRDKVTFYFKVFSNHSKTETNEHSFVLVETGKEFESGFTDFVNTLVFDDGYYILHIFKVNG